MLITCGMNGFGRFGLHFLNNYMDSIRTANFDLKYINDDTLTIDDAYTILVTDKYVRLYDRHDISIDGDFLVIDDVRIEYSNVPAQKISWVGGPDVFLECSGKFTDANRAKYFKQGNTRVVAVSATSVNAGQTLIYGYNHNDYKKDVDVISYGSCTVNSFVPLAHRLNELFGIVSADVNVVHNIPEYQLGDESKNTLRRTKCTLSVMAPKLLGFISDDNFNVNYTLVPYSGVSILDYRLDEFSLSKYACK